MKNIVNVEIDHLGWYATIQIDGFPKHWLELNGSYWCLKTSNSFNKPLKSWLESKNIHIIVAESILLITGNKK